MNALIYSHWWIRDRLLLALSAVSVCSIFILTLLASAKFSDFLLLLLPTLWSVVGILIPFLSRISMIWNKWTLVIHKKLEIGGLVIYNISNVTYDKKEKQIE